MEKNGCHGFIYISGPFSQPVSSVMYLTNPSDRKVCFKIKTTAPKKYCVKPNSGVIDPDEKVKISGNNIAAKSVLFR